MKTLKIFEFDQPEVIKKNILSMAIKRFLAEK
jgi:hypothetical protein